MEIETLNVFDEQGNQIGVATRDEVHKHGYWHETFHCWLISFEENKHTIYFQLRSPKKKDYPNLFDITAAGHILSDETIEEGIREVKEEIGIDVKISELISLGIVKNSILLDNFIDNELSHVFLYKIDPMKIQFTLQEEEVSGIVKAEFKSFYEFSMGMLKSIEVEGFEVNDRGERIPILKKVTNVDFIPHNGTYLKSVANLIKNHLT